MKRAAIIYYTDRGGETAEKISAALGGDYETELYRARCKLEDLFSAVDALIFVGACGIAVRAIAPYVRDKCSDPAVVVADERGMNVISLLSGHIGGANELTRRIAAAIGANPVVTTATDVNHRFAADEWAQKNGLVISSMQAARRFAAEILRRDLPVYSDFPVCGALPNGLFAGKNGDCGLVISCRPQAYFSETLTLIPRILHLGIGCKRGTHMEKIEELVRTALEQAGCDVRAIRDVSSIDLKQDEACLSAFCAAWNLPARFYTAEALRRASGEFSASAFVHNTVGVDNVCERAAMCSAGENARLIVKKICRDGVTVAIAQEDWRICFE